MSADLSPVPGELKRSEVLRHGERRKGERRQPKEWPTPTALMVVGALLMVTCVLSMLL